jgi:protein involved in polysaccharide export with SLBB domain
MRIRGFGASMKALFVIGVSLFTMLSAKVGFGQFTEPSSGSSVGAPTIKTPLQKQSVTVNGEALIYDGAIDPNEYRIGPGDLLEMQLWTNGESSELVVSPDQLLIVPHVGQFDVRGKTLTQVRNDVEQQAKQSFKIPKTINNGEPISISLLQPRRIYVSVRGDVNYPNTYTLTSATRANIAIELANRAQQEQTAFFGDESRLRDQERKKRQAEQIRPYLGTSDENSASERYIKIIHSDGTSERVDLFRFNATKDPRFCPMLREGDEIFVPYKKRLEGLIGVYGSILVPGDYEFVEGDSLSAMIRNTLGTTPRSDLTRVELTRMSADGTQFQTTYHNLLAINSGKEADVPLTSGDRIFVRDTSDMRELSRVVVKGEVRRPGVYPMQRGVTKLSWIVDAAGGLTPNAFLPGGAISRSRLDLETSDITPEDDAMQVQRLANLSVTDTANFKLQATLRGGVANVDMYRLFAQGDSTADMVLRDGDVITIPTAPNDVYVWGYVGRTGYVPYKAGQNAEYYVNLAGGYAEGSVKSGTRIIKTRTKQWMEPGATEIGPGDEIYVPKTPDHGENYVLQTIGSIAAIVGGIASIIISYLFYKKAP